MSLGNGMCMAWLVDIIMRNVIYAEWSKEIYESEECALFWRQSICKRGRFFNIAGSTYDDSQKATKDSLISHSRLAFSAHHKDSFCLYKSGCLAAPILQLESRPLKERCFQTVGYVIVTETKRILYFVSLAAWLKGHSQSAMWPRWPGHYFRQFEKSLPQPEIKWTRQLQLEIRFNLAQCFIRSSIFYRKPLFEKTLIYPMTLFYHIWLKKVSKGTWIDEVRNA